MSIYTENPAVTDDVDANSNDGDIEEQSWFVSQSVAPSNTNILHHAPKYGFAGKLKGALGSFDVRLILSTKYFISII